MGGIERLETATKRLDALGRRSRLRGTPLGEDLHNGEQVLYAVGEFPGQHSLAFFKLLSRSDVARDLGGTDNSTGVVANRRDRQRNVDQTTVLAASDRFVVIDFYAASDALQDGRHLVLAIGCRQNRDWSTDHLLGSVAEEPFRGGVPAGDDAIKRLAHDTRMARRSATACPGRVITFCRSAPVDDPDFVAELREHGRAPTFPPARRTFCRRS